jgi:hypothetical protein
MAMVLMVPHVDMAAQALKVVELYYYPWCFEERRPPSRHGAL